MKNRVVLFGILGVIIVGGIFFFTKTPSQPTDNPEFTTLVEDAEEIQANDVTTDENTANPSYLPYSKANFTSASSQRRVLFFYASWCPTCRPVDAELNSNGAQIPADVTIIRVNYNDDETDQEEKDLAKKYGVTYQHTFVQIDSQGNEVTKWNGGSLQEILSNIK